MLSFLKSWPACIAAKIVFTLFALIFGVWASFAFWFQLPVGDAVRGSVIVVWLAFILLMVVGDWRAILRRQKLRSRRRAGLSDESMFRRWDRTEDLRLTRIKRNRRLFFCLLVVIILAWWATIRPSLDRIWAPEVAHTVTGTVDGDKVTLYNVRDFNWRTTDDFTEHWKQETYDLNTITSVDVYLSYWSGPAIAHTLLSFGFADGRHVVFSGEIRREHYETYSALGGFFRKFELAMIAAEERDIIYLRTNIRKENVYRYRVKLPPAAAKQLFLSYVALGNELAQKPEFYNTLTTNCTTIIFKMARVLDPSFPFDYRVVLSGYLPGYLHDHGWLADDGPLAEVEKRAAIDARAQAGGRDNYSARIRQ